MLRRVILAMMLVVALIVTSSCGLIIKDMEVDKQTPIIEVAGKVFTKAEVTDEVNYTLDYQEYIYSMYGMSFDKTSKTAIADAREQTVDGLIQQAVVEQKETEMGMTTFTEEELAALQTEVDDSYQTNFDSVKTSYFAETDLEGEELDQAVAARMEELGYSSKEQMLESKKSTKAYEKLKAEVVKDVQVTDEEIQTSYDEKVAAAKTEYESSLPAYGSAVRGGTTVYYNPAGYRYVKNILVKISDEDSQAISDLESELSDKQTQLSAIPAASDANSGLAEGEEAVELTEDEKKALQAQEETRATLTAEIADLQTQLDAAKEKAYANIQPTVDEIQGKLKEGGDFDAIMAEYGQDPGMQTSPGMEQGYLVCTGDTAWVAEFTEAAMALEKVGDVSPAVRTSYGIHILQYAGDLAEGDVPLSDVKETISDEILSSKQDEQFNATLEQWVTEANAKVDWNALKN